MSRSISHDQARGLASRRLDEPLTGADQAALDRHLEGCQACTAVAAAYEADRLALHALPPIEPPRDLWARTRVALEREHAQHPASARRLPRRWGPVAGLAGGVALVLVIVIVGPTLIGPSAAPGTIGLAPSGPIGTSQPQPAVTPIAVDSQVTWAVTEGTKGTSLVTANVSSVCPSGDEPDCPPVAGVARLLNSLPTVPTSVTLSPTNGGQGIVGGPSADQAGTSLYVVSVPPEPTPAPPASTPPASLGPTSSRAPNAGSSQAPASPPATPSASPVQTASPTPAPTALPTSSPTTPVGVTPPSASPSPSPVDRRLALAVGDGFDQPSALGQSVPIGGRRAGDREQRGPRRQRRSLQPGRPLVRLLGPAGWVIRRSGRVCLAGRLAGSSSDHVQSRFGVLRLGRRPDPGQPGHRARGGRSVRRGKPSQPARARRPAQVLRPAPRLRVSPAGGSRRRPPSRSIRPAA